MKCEPPQQYRFVPVNSPGLLTMWRAVIVLVGLLDPESREMLKSAFPSRQPLVKSDLPEAFDSHFHWDRLLRKIHGTEEDIQEICNSLQINETSQVEVGGEETYDTKYACGTEYPMDSVKSMYLNYDGNDVGTEKCEIKFTITDTSDYTICVQPISLNLDCGTTIEYHEDFVAKYSNAGELECSMNGQTSYEGHCGYYNYEFFIVIKKENPTLDTDESASFHVYAEEKKKYNSGMGYIGLAAIAPILVVVLVCITCIKWQRNQRQMNRNTQVTYNTSVSATAMPIGGVSQYPVTPNQQAYPQSGYPQSGYPQTAVPGNPVQQSAGGYYVHPTVTAYPAQNPQPPYNYQPVPQASSAFNPSAPPRDNKSLPPPSYESLLNK